jgi:3-phenylpropionate/trans-cinnamate dioxygenase ferredoxin reductase component
MVEHCDVLIVGTGHGGAQAAISLRQRKFTGSITLVGEEPELPYDRPPLSKEYLSGERGFERLLVRPPAFWSQRQISILTGRAAVSVNPHEHTVELSNADVLHYGGLIWAAGGRAKRLTCTGHDLRGVHTLRNKSDVDRVTRELPSTRQVAVIGGGYIGLEAAAALCKRGVQVTVLEALDRVLARVAGEPLSRFYESEHRAHGVDIRLDTIVECIEENEGWAAGVRLAAGRSIAADMVIVGIGILPNVEPLLAAGAVGDNGVAVDAYCRTSLPDIWAIGDCALHPNSSAGGRRLRLESVQNASDMALTVAKALTGAPEPYTAVPWFWSNQYDLRLQTVGLSLGHDEALIRGDIKSRSFSVIYRKAGRVIALDCVNAPKDYAQGRALVINAVATESSALTDTNVALKTLCGHAGVESTSS